MKAALSPRARCLSYELPSRHRLGRDPKRHEQGFLTFLRTPVRVLPPNKSIMKQFGHLCGQIRQSGQLIGDFDIRIAATALYHDFTLLTRNIRHFRRIPNLKLYQPDSNTN